MQLFPKSVEREKTVSIIVSGVLFLLAVYFIAQEQSATAFFLIIGGALLIPIVWQYMPHMRVIKWPIVVIVLLLCIMTTQTQEVIEVINIIPFGKQAEPTLDLPIPVEEEEGVVSVGEKTHYMKIIKSKHLDPPLLNIKAGDTVEFVNEFSTHVLHIYQDGGDYKHITMSGKLPPGGRFAYTFEEPGEYFVRDLYFNFRGKIMVE